MRQKVEDGSASRPLISADALGQPEFRSDLNRSRYRVSCSSTGSRASPSRKLRSCSANSAYAVRRRLSSASRSADFCGFSIAYSDSIIGCSLAAYNNPCTSDMNNQCGHRQLAEPDVSHECLVKTAIRMRDRAEGTRTYTKLWTHQRRVSGVQQEGGE